MKCIQNYNPKINYKNATLSQHLHFLKLRIEHYNGVIVNIILILVRFIYIYIYIYYLYNNVLPGV